MAWEKSHVASDRNFVFWGKGTLEKGRCQMRTMGKLFVILVLSLSATELFGAEAPAPAVTNLDPPRCGIGNGAIIVGTGFDAIANSVKFATEDGAHFVQWDNVASSKGGTNISLVVPNNFSDNAPVVEDQTYVVTVTVGGNTSTTASNCHLMVVGKTLDWTSLNNRPIGGNQSFSVTGGLIQAGFVSEGVESIDVSLLPPGGGQLLLTTKTSDGTSTPQRVWLDPSTLAPGSYKILLLGDKMSIKPIGPIPSSSFNIVGPSTITVTPDTINLSPGDTRVFGAIGRDTGGQLMGSVFTWSSSDPTKGSIDPVTGEFSAIAEANITITAKCGIVTGTATVHITAIPVATTITLSPASANLVVNQTLVLDGEVYDQFGVLMGKPNLATSDAAVATVNGGVVTAMGPGTATISATAGTAPAAQCTITVTILSSIVITPASATVAVGSSQQFAAEGYDQNGKWMPVKVLWSLSNTSDPNVGTVDDHGTFTGGKTVGLAYVIASSGNITKSVAVTVVATTPTPFVSTIPPVNPIAGLDTTWYVQYTEGATVVVHIHRSDGTDVDVAPTSTQEVGSGIVMAQFDYQFPPGQSTVTTTATDSNGVATVQTNIFTVAQGFPMRLPFVEFETWKQKTPKNPTLYPWIDFLGPTGKTGKQKEKIGTVWFTAKPGWKRGSVLFQETAKVPPTN